MIFFFKLPRTNASHVQNICLIQTKFTSKHRYFCPLSHKVTLIELGLTDFSQITSERREGTFQAIINRPTHEINVKTHFKTAIKTSHTQEQNKNYTAGFPHPFWCSRFKNYSDTTSTFRTATVCSRLVLHY